MQVYLAPDPNNDRAYLVNDGEWHYLTATIINLNATMTVDHHTGRGMHGAVIWCLVL
jgi:hypothetical protein